MDNGINGFYTLPVVSKKSFNLCYFFYENVKYVKSEM